MSPWTVARGTITVTRPHATGEMVLVIPADNATASKFVTGADLGDIMLTYAAQGGMSIGAQVEVDIPDVWGPIFLDNDDDDSSPRRGHTCIQATTLVHWKLWAAR